MVSKLFQIVLQLTLARAQTERQSDDKSAWVYRIVSPSVLCAQAPSTCLPDFLRTLLLLPPRIRRHEFNATM
jgi:hypothetical protein